MNTETIRLDKYLANLGLCSRREVKSFLKSNTITVNGQRTRESGTRINSEKDKIFLNGKTLRQPPLVYYLLNKPKGIISTTRDEKSRRNVVSFIPHEERIYPVGRLDKDTTGLILLTNDGTLTNRLTHPKYHVDKTYRLTVLGKTTADQLKILRNGVILTDGITSPAIVTVINETNKRSEIEMTIHEGRNRQIRRMCEAVKLELLELQRIQFGPIKIDGLKEGCYRELTQKEIALFVSLTHKSVANSTT